jgi:hypothetical protein
MIFAPVNPATARQYFKRRVLKSYVVLGGVFLLLATLFAWGASLVFENFAPLLLGTAFLLGTALAGLFVYYTYVVWNKQPMRIRCKHCKGIVLCRTPWVCGECGHENWDVSKTSLLDECEECHLLPKAYLCHHCNQTMFLSQDQDQTNPARRISTQGHQPKARSEKQRQGEENFVQQKTSLERELETAKIVLAKEQVNAQIEVVKKGITVTDGQIQSALDIQVKSLKAFMDVATAVSEAARRQKALNAQECQNNPAERRRRDLIVDEWVRRQLVNET